MQLARVKISSIMGIEEVEFDVKSLTIVKGKNGLGKTSISEAIRAALGEGNEAQILRNGAKKGEIVLEFDNGHKLSRKISENGKKSTSMVDELGRKIESPVSQIKGLLNVLSINPVEIITLKADKRVNYVKENLPTFLDKVKLDKALRNSKLDININYDTADALTELKSIHKALYDKRAVSNQLIKNCNASLERLEESAVTIDVDVPALQKEQEDISNKQEKQRELKHELKEKFLIELNESLAKAKAEYDAIVDNLKSKHQAKLTQLENGFNSEYLPLQERLLEVNSALQNASAHSATLNNIAQTKKELTHYLKDKEVLQDAMEQVQQIQKETIANLPVPGLEIREDDIYYNDVPFPRLNTATKFKLAFELHKVRNPELKFVCVDGFEALDMESRLEFAKVIKESDYQAIAMLVSDDEELKIDSISN